MTHNVIIQRGLNLRELYVKKNLLKIIQVIDYGF